MMETDRFEPHQRAWMTSFFDENHLNHTTSPDLVASPAQMKFMVAPHHDQPYFPCAQDLYEAIMARIKSPALGEQYAAVWGRTADLVKRKIEDPARREYLLDLLNIKHQHETGNYNVIPSRLEKRLFKLFMVTTQIEDPLQAEKEAHNRKAHDVYRGEPFIHAVNSPGGPHLPAACYESETIESARRHLDAAKLKRLIQVSTAFPGLDQPVDLPGDAEGWARLFGRDIEGDGWQRLEDALLTPRLDLLGFWTPRRILYLADRAGEIVFDLAVIKFLIRLGHVVVLAVKNAASFDRVYLGDLINDPVLKPLIESAEIITAPRLSKNQLARKLKNDHPFNIITDGTMESLNLMRTSITFSRAFKEVDLVISKGLEQRAVLFQTPFTFTQDIFSLAPAPDGSLSVRFKPRSPETVRFTTADLEARAAEIVGRMRQAKEAGMTVMFYSGVVGSIPGETDTAVEIMTAFINHLEQQQARTHIINPSRHFQPGMDADDLMYMWEIVQRSGLIDIWRFQTYQDIETAFRLLGRKVPPEWVGKDATFSTGCTKERAIAAEVQRQNPEMQIIGPGPEKFSRRSEYGIGLFHDTRLAELPDY